MDAIGLWTIAAKLPDKTAVVEPDGTMVTYAEGVSAGICPITRQDVGGGDPHRLV